MAPSITEAGLHLEPETPLLHDPHTTYDSVPKGTVDTTTAKEVRFIVKNAVPVALTFGLQYFLAAAAIFVVGHLGNDELAAMSLANTTAGVIGYAVTQGIATCLDTLATQAFGRGDLAMVGLHSQRCIVFLALINVPIMLIWWFSEPLLNLFIPQPEVAHLSAMCLKVLTVGLPGYYIFETLKHFLQAQEIFQATTYILLICTPVNLVLYYVLVWHEDYGLGLIGAPLAIVITDWLMAILAGLYIYFINGSQCWANPVPADLFRNWGPMASLAMPGVLMVEAEWLAFEFLTVLSAQLGTITLAAQAIVGALSTMAFQIPLSLGITVSARVGNLIGSGSPIAAKHASQAGLQLSLLVGGANMSIMFVFRNHLGKLFSPDPEVVSMVASVLPLAALYQVNDSIGGTSGGILRGQGRQFIGGIINVVCYYVIMLPLAVLLAFHFGFGLQGLWAGIGFGVFLVSFGQYYYVRISDWHGLAARAAEATV